MTHDELMIRLADYLGGMTDRMIWTDMQLGPCGSPRPDVYTIRKSYTQPKPMAYEVKVSVSDFRSDVTKGKWQTYLKFATGVIFVVPKGLITKADVPNGCGLMTYNQETDSFTNLKKATLQAVTLPQQAMLKLLIDGVDRQHEVNRRRWLDEYQAEKRVRKALGDQVAAAVFDVKQAERNRDYQLEKINRQIEFEEARLAQVKERATEERKRVDADAKKAFEQLYEALGMVPGGFHNTFAIKRRILELVSALERDSVIADLEDQLDSVRKMVASLTPLEKLRQAAGVEAKGEVA